MRLGALLTPADGGDANHLANSARAIERAGFDSIWSAHAMGRGFMMADPFVALSAAATVTDLEVGTAILQLPLYNPTDVALKAFALQQIAGGRLVLGVGAGSTESDYVVHGEAFAERFTRFESALAALRATFTDGSAGDGNLTPWPAVQGGPPVFFGTWGKNVERAAREFDGWIASGMHRTPEQCAAAIERYRSAGGQRAIVSTIRVMPGDDFNDLKSRLGRFEATGFDDAVVMILPGGPSYDAVRELV